jgi:hypothetical protein
MLLCRRMRHGSRRQHEPGSRLMSAARRGAMIPRNVELLRLHEAEPKPIASSRRDFDDVPQRLAQVGLVGQRLDRCGTDGARGFHPGSNAFQGW